jgi:hypothetical protein
MLCCFWAQEGIWTTHKILGGIRPRTDTFGIVCLRIIMATSKAIKRPERQSTGRCISRAPRTNRGRESSSYDDACMDRYLANMQSMSREQGVKGIAAVPEIRRSKVLSIRSQITKGTYPVEDRLDWALDRVLEVITA